MYKENGEAAMTNYRQRIDFFNIKIILQQIKNEMVDYIEILRHKAVEKTGKSKRKEGGARRVEEDGEEIPVILRFCGIEEERSFLLAAPLVLAYLSEVNWNYWK
tara:strand:- start:93 stop:404 length:312 start_codon:yes stop_codon:yes gene_type:complete